MLFAFSYNSSSLLKQLTVFWEERQTDQAKLHPKMRLVAEGGDSVVISVKSPSLILRSQTDYPESKFLRRFPQYPYKNLRDICMP